MTIVIIVRIGWRIVRLVIVMTIVTIVRIVMEDSDSYECILCSGARVRHRHYSATSRQSLRHSPP